HREAGNSTGVVLALMQIGYIHMCAGEGESAARWFSECARTCESSGNVWYHAYAQWGLGVAATLRADHEGAAQLGRAALGTIRLMDGGRGVGLCRDARAGPAAPRNEAIGGVTLPAAAETAGAPIPAVPAAPLRRHHDAALATARTALPGAEYR